MVQSRNRSFKYVQYWFKEVLLSDMIQSGKVDLRFAFVRKIVNLHGGSLLIEEDKNHHSVLKIWIPKKVKSNKEHFKRK